MEQWKVIDGFPNYEISNKGNVRNKKYGHLLKPSVSKNGYNYVALCLDGKPKKKYVHRLVATYFLQSKNGKLQVNHINGIKTDNRVENLEWTTSSENLLHANRILGKNNRGTPKRKVLCVETGKIYSSASEAAKAVSGSIGTLAGVCRGIGETYKGYHWEYIN